MAHSSQNGGHFDAHPTTPHPLSTPPTLGSPANTPHEDCDIRTLWSIFLATVQGQSGVQVEPSSDDPALNFDQGLLSPFAPTQPEGSMALVDFYHENFESVTNESISATADTAAGAQCLPLLNEDACRSSSETLGGHKRRFDAIDSEFDFEDDACATLSTTQSAIDVTRSNNEFLPPPFNAQQSLFHHAASQPVATFRGTSADLDNAPVAGHSYNAPVAGHSYNAPVAGHSYNAPVAGHSYNAPVAGHSYNAPVAGHSYNAFPTRPHDEPVRPLHDLHSTRPLVGGGTMPLENYSTIIKLPRLLPLNLAPGHISAQVGSNPMYPVGSLPVKYNPVPRFPNPPVHQHLFSHQDAHYRPSHARFTSQQPANTMSNIPYQSTPGVPTFHSNPVNVPPNPRFPFPNGQVPAFTFKVPSVLQISKASQSVLAAVGPARNTTTNPPPISPSTESDDDPLDNRIKIHTQHVSFACPFPGCETMFTGLDATKGHVQSHFNSTHYRGLDLTAEVKCPLSTCLAMGQRLGRGRHVVEVHWKNRRYQCPRCDVSFTRNSKAKEHIYGGACANKRQRKV